MIEHLLKTMDGRYINKYMDKVKDNLKEIICEIPFKIAETYFEKLKNDIYSNISEKNLSSDEVIFSKNYIFHEEKGFWKHLIDWNAQKEQEIKRAAAWSEYTKSLDKDSGEKDNE